MGGLAHFFENEGLATTSISLVREHTEIIKPPRALWVPFPLGRPLGAPNDPEFQKRVLLSVLNLLEAPSGPVLEDFPEDAPQAEAAPQPVACPVSFAPAEADLTDLEKLLAAFADEAAQMRTWYDLAVAGRGRTTTGTSGLEPERVVEFISAYARGERPENPTSEIMPAMALKMAVEDLKAYYFEAVSAQPGQPTDPASLAEWFWGSTAAAQTINAVRKACLASEDKSLQGIGRLALVPRTQLHRFD